MAKFIILFFISSGAGVSYLTYNGIGQETIRTRDSVRSNSSTSGSRHSSYNSSSYGYGK